MWKTSGLLPSGERHRSALYDSGAVARIDVVELVRRISWDGVAAVGASVHVITDGHAARLTGFLIGVLSLHGTRSKAHDVSPFFLRSSPSPPLSCGRHGMTFQSYAKYINFANAWS